MYEVFDIRPLFDVSEHTRLDLSLPWAIMLKAGEPGWASEPLRYVASEGEARALANTLESAAVPS